MAGRGCIGALVARAAAFPPSVAEYLWSALQDGSLLEACAVTLRRLLIGYALGVVLGLPLELIMSTSQFAEDTLSSLALGLQTGWQTPRGCGQGWARAG